jgi:hypothetical protein
MPARKSTSELFPIDLAEYLDEEEDNYYRKLFHKNSYPVRADIQSYGEYKRYRWKHKLTAAQAELAANFKMPAKKYPRGGASARGRAGKAMRTTARPKQRATVTASSATNAALMAKAAEAAAKKMMSKAIESQHSYCTITLDTDSSPAQQWQRTGRTLGPLNNKYRVPTSDNTVDRLYSSSQMLAFNLSALSQVKGNQTGVASGWRVGHKILAEYIKIDVRGELSTLSADCTYHIMMCRRKDGQTGAWWAPSLVDASDVALWRPNNEGPLSDNNRIATELSLNRKNTECWTFTKDADDHRSVNAYPIANGQQMKRHVKLSIFHKFDSAFEFTSAVPTGTPTMKDGDYYLFFFREGPPDFSVREKWEVNVDLKFKDA